MKYKLINENIDTSLSAVEQILVNRGIKYNEIHHYLNTTDNDINNAEAFGIERLKAAASALIKTINNNDDAIIIVDADCDGFTSSAILINYLYDFFPTWVENKLKYYIHDNKAHGLNDCIDFILERNYKLVIIPDAGSNDYVYHHQLAEKNIPIIILDHHEAEKISEDAIVINNQLCDYPNKDFSGAGVTWQFCRYLDKLMGKNNADNYLDLVSLGLR